jgi:hypothetical protein
LILKNPTNFSKENRRKRWRIGAVKYKERKAGGIELSEIMEVVVCGRRG